jgi:hypothetical protein
MTKGVDKVNKYGQMDQFIKDIGKMIWQMGLED